MSKIEGLTIEHTVDADGRISYELQDPVEFGDEVVTTLRFRKMKGKDWRAIPMDQASVTFGSLIDIAGKLCGRDPVFMDELSSADTLAAIEVTNHFLGSSRATP